MHKLFSTSLPSVLAALACFGMLLGPATAEAQSSAKNETQEKSNLDKSADANRGQGETDPVAPKAQAGESSATDQITEKDQKPKFKVGRITFPTYQFELGDKKLFYGLYLPTSFDKTKTYPLIVVLHGLNGSPGQILAYPGLTKHAEDEGYIMVAPMGYNPRGWYGSRGKGGGRGSDPKNLGELSEQDVMEVLKLTRNNFNIDPQRIYLFGHSMGGGGSMHLAMTYPDIWAAMAVVAPAAYGNRDRLATAKNIPAFIVQGDQDRLVSVQQTRLWVKKMKDLKMKHEYVEVEGGGHVFLAWQHFDGIFAFFAENPKKTQPQSQPK